MALVPSRSSTGFVDAWYEPLSRIGLSDVASGGRITGVSLSGMWPTKLAYCNRTKAHFVAEVTQRPCNRGAG